jgi:phosphoribosyl-ATP pyrophosphohydrolase/phosphoribosyl-AMP cyclohydrolase
VVDVRVDCDRDTLLMRAHPTGPTCHKGTRTCFEPNPSVFELGWLWEILLERTEADPETSYTARLLQEGLPRVAQKVGEEAVETVIASLTPRDAAADAEFTAEAADLLYHLLVLLLAHGMTPAHLAEELKRRHAAKGGVK